MRGLSVRQPDASLIAAGRKSIERRWWRTSYRGPLVICATAAKFRYHSHGAELPVDVPHGVAVALVQLVDCRPFELHDVGPARVEYISDTWAWHMRLIAALPPVTSVKGRLGLFVLPVPAAREIARYAD